MGDFLIILNILCVSIELLIGFVQLAMLIRAILSFFNPEEQGLLSALLYAVTEPFIMPVRALLDRFKIGQGLPIDISFLVTVILLSVISALLPGISL